LFTKPLDGFIVQEAVRALELMLSPGMVHHMNRFSKASLRLRPFRYRGSAKMPIWVGSVCLIIKPVDSHSVVEVFSWYDQHSKVGGRWWQSCYPFDVHCIPWSCSGRVYIWNQHHIWGLKTLRSLVEDEDAWPRINFLSRHQDHQDSWLSTLLISQPFQWPIYLSECSLHSP